MNMAKREKTTFQSPTAQLIGMDLGSWPELDELALKIADEVIRQIAAAALNDPHKVPYKTLTLKGKVIQILQRRL